jgi:UDP-N-acetyl-D-mannosaminuronic acid dehydrogenase
MLLAVSRVNESVPLFVVEGIKRRLGDLRDRKVAVLGLAFKGDTDDERDSLSHKLIRMLERELADVAVHDPVVPTPTSTFDEAVSGADVVVVATNHSAYSNADALAAIAQGAAPDCLVVDPWNAFGAAQVFGYASEIAALRAPAT